MTRSFASTFVRHQAASVVATLVDFTIMIALVEVQRMRPDSATFFGAALGALSNFTLGRVWTFRAVATPLFPQAARYAVISAASAALNVLGIHALVHGWGLPYVSSRIAVASLVSVFWNFPAHKLFVFRSSP